MEGATRRKSSRSFSNGNRVEIASWRTPARSTADGQCVEIGSGQRVVGVRDSKNPGPVLRFTPGQWRAFLGRLAAPPLASSLPDLRALPLPSLANMDAGILDEVIRRVIPETAGTPDTPFNSAI